MGQDSKIEWTHHTFNPWRFLRLAGWVWMPVPWLWRGCWDPEAAWESWRQGWIEFRSRSDRRGHGMLLPTTLKTGDQRPVPRRRRRDFRQGIALAHPGRNS